MSTQTEFDFVIIGGGTAGSVVASRLYEGNPSLSILIIEAGPDVSDRPEVLDGSRYASLLGGDLDWGYKTVPQKHLNGRVLTNHAGKALGGSTAINASGWTRGEKENYDQWARLADDGRWSYDNLLPYFRRVETYCDPNGDLTTHGFNGPIKMEPAFIRQYPLREPIKNAWAAVGVDFKLDMNDGNPVGLGQLIENRNGGVRQIASSVYPLKGVQIWTNTLVEKIVIQEAQDGRKVATAVEVSSTSQSDQILTVTARREIILAAGVYRSPQILMLSGLGPADELQKHGIEVVLDLTNVGKHFQDHTGVGQWWKLRDPEKGLSIGSPAFNNPIYFKGNPVDFVSTLSVSREGLLKALMTDDENDSELHAMESQHAHIEIYVIYAARNAEDPSISPDGTHISTSVVCLLPTSRGSIQLADANPHSAPVIDPNYLATEADRYVLREGLRLVARLLQETEIGQELVESETFESDGKPVTRDSTDQDLDELIRRRLRTMYHPAGSLSMGKVVDGSLLVKGVDRLRVVDASIMPSPIAGHIQNAVYVIAERAADMILETL